VKRADKIVDGPPRPAGNGNVHDPLPSGDVHDRHGARAGDRRISDVSDQEPPAPWITGQAVRLDAHADPVDPREIIAPKDSDRVLAPVGCEDEVGSMGDERPATAVSLKTYPTDLCVEMSMTSTASFAVCATKIRPVGSCTAAWSKPPAFGAAGARRTPDAGAAPQRPSASSETRRSTSATMRSRAAA
jgi:hypothetical protein